MTKEEIAQQVIRELSFIYDEQITSETTFDDLGMDSLDMIEFMSDCEDRFAINLDNCEAKPVNIADLVSEILEQTK